MEKVNDITTLWRKQFPILTQQVNGKPLVYFDNAATSQKPLRVIQSLSDYYTRYNSNVHRGVHTLSQMATDAFEEARELTASFIHAGEKEEVIFTKGTTDSINLVAQSFGEKFLQAGKEIWISAMEHHANIVPWQMICEKKGAKLKVIPMNREGVLLTEELYQNLSENIALIAVTHVSNSLGTINPVKEIIARAHTFGIPVLVDGAQAVPHMSVNVQELDCDFYCFSAHKMYGPTGIGVLYGKRKWLEAMPPYQGGGDMIETVTFEKTDYNVIPFKFEAGTPHIEGAIGLAEAIRFIQETGIENIEKREQELLHYAMEKLSEIEGITYIGTAPEKAAVISFLIEGAHPYDVGFILDKQGIAVRTGHHCTQPVMQFFDIPGTVRASFAFYNTEEEIGRLAEGIQKAKNMLL
ncbi:MAG: cysteine desulfurase [Flavobacteriales bacterium]|nr:cysteine desulfurase [Flavobacteriales bacterium]